MIYKKIVLLIYFLIFTIILTACTGSREVDNLGIVLLTAIDIEDEKIILTHEVMKPKRSTGGEKPAIEVEYIQSSGLTVFDAIRNATLNFDRKLFFSHNRVYIFGEEFARRGIGDYINFYLYDNEPRETSLILVAQGSKAYEVIGINGGIASTSSRYLEDLTQNFSLTSKTRNFTMYEYFRYFYSNGSPVVGVVRKKERKEIINADENSQSKKLALDISGGAVFDKDILVGYYTGEEMIGFNYIVDEIEGGLIVFETPDVFMNKLDLVATGNKYTTIEVASSKTKRDIKIEDGKIHLYIDVVIKGILGEETKGLRVTELEIKDAIEKACSDKVKEYISITMEKAQKEFKLDTFSIDTVFHGQHPKEWRDVSDNWLSVFSDLEYTVNVRTHVIRTGLINIPTNIEKEGE